MVTRAQKVRLGVFLIFSFALLVGTVGVLAGLKIVEKRDEYQVRFRVSVSGLELGAQVKYNGVRVGSVQSIRINRDDVREVIVTLSLDEGTPIKADTRAVLNAAGITGLKFIELTQGSVKSAFLKPGDEIAAGESFLDKLTGQAEAIAEKAELLLNNLNKLLSDENRERFGELLESAEEVATSTAQLIEDNRENIRAISSSLAETSAGLDAMVQNLDKEANATIRAVRTVAEKLGETVDPKQVSRLLDNTDRLVVALRRKVSGTDIEGAVKTVTSLASRAGRLVENVDLTVMKSREDLFASLAYLLEGLENFSEFARMIRENPTLLLSGPKETERD